MMLIKNQRKSRLVDKNLREITICFEKPKDTLCFLSKTQGNQCSELLGYAVSNGMPRWSPWDPVGPHGASMGSPWGARGSIRGKNYIYIYIYTNFRSTALRLYLYTK